jgi:Kef-type K+ transport system membrane component KefB/Trk K+ transport system NAD-binding subunit
MEASRSFLPLLIVVVLAFVVPLGLGRLRRVRLPIVVGEILAGILVGRSGLGWVAPDDQVLELLAEFGFAFLMFLSGMELDFRGLGLSQDETNDNDTTWGPVALGVVTFAFTLLLSAAVGFSLAAFGLVRSPWLMALILSTTSLGVVMPVLKETGMSQGRYGQSLLMAALVADFATMLLLTVVIAALSHGFTLDIFLIGLLFVAFFLMYHWGMVLFRGKALRRAMEQMQHTPAQIKVRAAYTVMLIFIVLAQALGTEVILGAFLAGTIISLVRPPEDAELVHQLEVIGFSFFIPIFFIQVGVQFNLSALSASPNAFLLVPLLLVAAVVVKFVPGLLFKVSFAWRETLAAGALLSARLSLIIATAAIGVRLGVISESVNAAIILVALITVTGAPLAFIGSFPGLAGGERRPIIVAGAEELGLQVAEQLAAHQERVVLIDFDAQRLERARQHGFETLRARTDFRDPSVAELLEHASVLVCTYNNPHLSYRVCHTALTYYGIEHVVAEVNEPAQVPRFRDLGVTTTNAAMDRAALMALLVRSPAVYTLLTRTQGDKDVIEVVARGRRLVGKTLRQLPLPGDTLVLALRRGGELHVPHGSTELELGDRLTLAASQEWIEPARQLFESR